MPSIILLQQTNMEVEITKDQVAPIWENGQGYAMNAQGGLRRLLTWQDLKNTS